VGSEGTKIIQINQDKGLVKFFYYAIQNRNLASEGYKRHFSKLREQKFCYPTITEQQKIVQILSSVDTAIQNTNQLILQTERLKKALMQKLLTGGIGHSKFKKTKLSYNIYEEIPEEWNITKIANISEKITYGFTNPMPHTNDGPFIVTATNIKNGKINYEKCFRTSLDAFNKLLTKKSKPKQGTVLITKDGTLGEVGIVDKDGICINQSVASLEINSLIMKEFFVFILQSNLIKKYIIISSPQTTIRHIYITEIPKWKIPLPPLSEQRQISSILSNIDSQIQKEKLYKSNLKLLKKGLMQNLLTGKIRIK